MNNINGILYLVDVTNGFTLIPIDLSKEDLQLELFVDLQDKKGNKYMFYPTETKEEIKTYIKNK